MEKNANRICLPVFAAAVLLANMLFPSCSMRSAYVRITGYAQGGTYSVVLNTADAEGKEICSPQLLKSGIDSIISAVDVSVSGYNKESLLSRFNAGDPVVPDFVFTDIYNRSSALYRKTSGIVDVASAPLYDIWGFGFTADSLPPADVVEKVRAECGMGLLKERLEDAVADDGSVMGKSLVAEGREEVIVKLNYNAVAQGYTCDLVASYLEGFGIKDMLVDIGGEIFCSGLNPDGRQWSLGIDRPVDGNMKPGKDLQGVFRAPVEPCGIVTSGNYRKFYVKDGKKYAHTIDPRTGYPVSHSLLSATIVAGNATDADAYATYCMAVGLEDASAFISSEEGVEGCLIYEKDGNLEVWTSEGFRLEDGK